MTPKGSIMEQHAKCTDIMIDEINARNTRRRKELETEPRTSRSGVGVASCVQTGQFTEECPRGQILSIVAQRAANNVPTCG